ncbi:MAG TPA: hypothetical protein VFB79_17215 [Candidatus Angelobacter sp.]|nr:hypothetical protein [Candidatus Angelobacter sp.]
MKRNLLSAALLLLLTAAGLSAQQTVPRDTEIKVRTDTAIPAKPAANARYTATVSKDVADGSGNVIIPRGARAHLVAVASEDGKDTTLDLRSVSFNGHSYLLEAPGESEGGTPGGLGANKRTGKYVGGGAAVGAVLGALLGGGKGAAVGALVGGAGGAGAQVYTGQKKALPAESELNYKLASDLTMRPIVKHAAASAPRK